MLDIDASLENCSYIRRKQSSPRMTFWSLSVTVVSEDTTLTVKKCFSESCGICSPPRLPPAVYQDLHYLPDPILSDSEDGHYKSFDKMYGQQTTEKDRPSAKRAKETGSHCFTVKNVKNANLMLQCEECELWLLIYSEAKLTQVQKSSLQDGLWDSVFTCGSSIEGLELEGIVNVNVYTRPLNCYDPVEKQYYSAGYTFLSRLLLEVCTDTKVVVSVAGSVN